MAVTPADSSSMSPQASQIRIVDCTFAAHGEPILEIFNDVIATSTALFEYEPRTLGRIESWFAAKAEQQHPVIGAIDGERLLGFATYGTFRAWPAYKYAVEHSVYVARDAWRRGIGRRLLTGLIERAEAQDLHTLIAGIDAENAASIALHRELGFVRAGTIRDAGFKFGRWLDLVFYQRMLNTPESPVDG